MNNPQSDEKEPPFSHPVETTREGGLRAPSHLSNWGKWWWWFDFIVLVNLARFRFFAILALMGVIITQWDLLIAYYDRWTRPTTVERSANANVEWFCPMHPAIVRDNPKEKCPICFMPLSKRTKNNASAESLPAGVVNRVQLSPYRVVLAGVETWTVDFVPLSKQITAVGNIEFDESGQRSISARFNGRIDELVVNETGRIVAKGDVLASIYSPELNVATKSLLDAKKAGNREMLASTRTRLQLLGISDDQIDDILKSEKPSTHLKVQAPISGHVIRKYVREGQYVQEGMPLFDIADLSTVWVQAQVYEDDLSFLMETMDHEGSSIKDMIPVSATTRALPNEKFHGLLTFVYPHVDQQTRTLTVRFELDNPEHKLRPGSAVSVYLEVPPERLAMLSGFKEITSESSRAQFAHGRLLAVPESSVIDTGNQKIVYRESSPNVYDGVLVTLGPKLIRPDGVPFFPVLDGLELGARIVSSGSFLVDAETRLNPAAGSIYFGGSGSGGAKTSVTKMRPTTPNDPDATISANLALLPREEREAVEDQRFCAVLSENRLGSMGPPIKLKLEGALVFLCCEGCREKALADPQATLAKAKQLRQSTPSNSAITIETRSELNIVAELAKLSSEDRAIAQSQKFCAVLGDSLLGTMGPPVKLMIDGQSVFLCCSSCRSSALSHAAQTLANARKLQASRP